MLSKLARRTAIRLASWLGFSSISHYKEDLADLESSFFELARQCRPFTMTSYERLYALHRAIEYVVRGRIPGDIVECGVWKGGSAMMAALSLKQFGDTQRRLYMYDTFEGMPPPTDEDVRLDGVTAEEEMSDPAFRDRLTAGLPSVKRNLSLTGYPSDRLVYVEGLVETTIPSTAPERIALLRLDTDWFESTYHEMRHLYPRLSPGGVLILDDYGYYKGAREAVDRFFEENGIVCLLHRVDYTGRVAVKPLTTARGRT